MAKLTLENLESVARKAAEKARGKAKTLVPAGTPKRKTSPRAKSIKLAAKSIKLAAEIVKLCTRSPAPDTQQKQKTIRLDDLKFRPPSGVCFVMTPDQQIIIGGPYDLNEGHRVAIETSRTEPCALFITQQVIINERCIETEQEAIAGDLR